MITWNEFAEFALPSVLLWMAGAIAAWKGRPYASVLLTVAGCASMPHSSQFSGPGFTALPYARWARRDCGILFS